MDFQPNTIYHVYNQGNNQQKIFFNDENYLYFIRKIREHILPYADVLAYCLMPNHFHLLIFTKENVSELSKSVKPNKVEILDQVDTMPLAFQNVLNQSIGIMLSSYTKAINKQENRSGSLFRGKTKAKNEILEELFEFPKENELCKLSIEGEYSRLCFLYIHNNPVKAKLVKSASDWIYSSARDYEGLRKGTLCNQVLAKSLGLF